MKAKILTIAVAASLGSSTAFAFVSTPILFDRDGGGAGGAILVDTFDWSPDNGVSINVIGELQDGSSKELRAQSSLATFQYTPAGGSTTNYLPFAGTEFTFQLSVYEFAAGIGTGTAGFFLDPANPSLFTIYYDASKDAVPLAGTGYGDGIPILTGTVAGLSGNFTSFTDLIPGSLPVPLDAFGANNYPNVVTDQGNGSTTLEINVLSYDPAFFLNDISSLLIDVNLTTNAATPFVQVDPSAQIYGHTVNWGNNTTGQEWNGLDTCGTTAPDNCDFHFQTDASNTFQRVPEPGSLVLLGLGASLLGWTNRRRKMK